MSNSKSEEMARQYTTCLQKRVRGCVNELLTQAFFCTPKRGCPWVIKQNDSRWCRVQNVPNLSRPYNTTSDTIEDLTPRGTVPNGILQHVNTASMANLPFLEGLIGNWKAWPHKHWKRHVHKSSSRLNFTMPHARHIGGWLLHQLWPRPLATDTKKRNIERPRNSGLKMSREHHRTS